MPKPAKIQITGKSTSSPTVTDFQKCQQVFVYGTLMRSGSNAWRMAKANFRGEASITGKLYQIDWYPGLVLEKSGPLAFGEVFKLENAQQLDELDLYEGREYRRVLCQSDLGQVWLWEYLGDTQRLVLIESGNWQTVSFDTE